MKKNLFHIVSDVEYCIAINAKVWLTFILRITDTKFTVEISFKARHGAVDRTQAVLRQTWFIRGYKLELGASTLDGYNQH